MVKKVAVLMGSDADLPVMQACLDALEAFQVPCVPRVLSAHRTPGETASFAAAAEGEGFGVIIAAAGGAAHLAGAVAAHTVLPVIGVPLAATPLAGFDALLSTAQMPPGVPVGCVGVGAFGARNAAYLAVAILALADPGLAARLRRFREEQADKVRRKDRELRTRGGDAPARPG